MTLPGLTPCERELFEIIRATIVRGSPPPTYRDLMAAIGSASTGLVYRRVGVLVDKGYIIRRKGHERTLALTPAAQSYTVHLPLALEVRLASHVVASGVTPQGVFVAALDAFLARQP